MSDDDTGKALIMMKAFFRCHQDGEEKLFYDQLRLVIRFPLDNHLYLVSFDGDVIAEYLWNDIW